MPLTLHPSAPPAYRAAVSPSMAPPPYEASISSASSRSASVDSTPRNPPTYVESVINATRYSPSMAATDPERMAALKKTLSEVFEGIVKRFSHFDQAAAGRLMERPIEARRLMSAIDHFDGAVADVFGNLRAVEHCAKRGKTGHPVVARVIDAIGPLDRELAGWVLPTTSMPHPDGDADSSTINRCVQEMRDDLHATYAALQAFHRNGTLGYQSGEQGADANGDARTRVHARCVVL